MNTRTINPAIQEIFRQAEVKIKDAIVNRPELSFQQIATDNFVSITFVNDCAKGIRKETGFARRPGMVKK